MREKNVGIELLRLILFFMIVIIHVTSVGIVEQGYGLEFGSNNWIYSIITRVLAGGAVIGFVLITGYLTANEEVTTIKKRIIRLLKPFIFYLPIYFILNIILTNEILTGSINTIKYLIQIQGNLYHLWYVIVFLVLMLLIPYINKALKQCTQLEYKKLIIVLITIVSLLYSLSIILKTYIFYGLFVSRILLFITIYIMGGYFSKYEIKINKYISLACYIGIGLLMSLMVLRIADYDLQIATLWQVLEINFVGVILSALFLFLCFAQFKMKSKFVTFMGNLVYGGYIVHVGYIPMLIKIYNPFKYVNDNLYWLHNLGFMLIIFTCSLVTEMIRKIIFREKLMEAKNK